MRIRQCTILAAAMGVFLAAAVPARGQIPRTFTNLQILEKDIDRGQLIEIMRGFAGGLRVRCNHCHVGENTETLEGFDFAADTKETKQIARLMLRMTREINTNLLSGIGRTPRLEVTCITCHHGVTRPQTLHDLLLTTVRDKNVEAAIEQYRELKRQYFGQGAYDFSAGSLNFVSEYLDRRMKNVDGAIAIMRFNVETHPDATWSHYQLGELYVQKGDKQSALASFERALQLNPSSEFIKRRIGEIR